MNSVIKNSENKENPQFSTHNLHTFGIKQVFTTPYYLHILLVSANSHQCLYGNMVEKQKPIKI